MPLQTMLTPSRRQEMVAAGLWSDRLLLDDFDQLVTSDPERVAIVQRSPVSGARLVLTYGELARRVERIALGLVALGVEAGEVVAFQLPNWWQFTALHLACLRIGAVTNPLMPIFRQRELRYMLSFGGAKVMVVPEEFRSFGYAAMMAELKPELPELRRVFAIGGKGEESFESYFLERAWESEMDAASVFAARRLGPDDVVQILYTSGTTGEPKGVMHTSNTLLAGLPAYVERVGLSGRDAVFMASPLAHQTGFLYGLLMPIVLGTRCVLQDVWMPDSAVKAIAEEGCAFTMASTPFLADLAASPEVPTQDLGRFRAFLCAGAPIPPILVQDAQAKLKIRVISAWGMSENGVVTATRAEDAPEKVVGTDGCALRGFEVRVVDEAGLVVPPGTEGRLQTRGAGNFVGYLKKPDLYQTDAEGWFETGDVARMDEDGYIRICGRIKDIIIRGGENIPVVEVESLLYRHPAVLAVAIVAVPDARLGERALAYVTVKLGAELTFEEMSAFLAKEKLAKNYFPEKLVTIEEMPRTASGKIQKFHLREMAAALAS